MALIAGNIFPSGLQGRNQLAHPWSQHHPRRVARFRSGKALPCNLVLQVDGRIIVRIGLRLGREGGIVLTYWEKVRKNIQIWTIPKFCPLESDSEQAPGRMALKKTKLRISATSVCQTLQAAPLI